KTTIEDADRVGGSVSPPDYTDWRRDNTVFTEMSALYSGSYALTGLGAAEQIPAAVVTGGFFAIMGQPAALGRTITTADDPIGSRDVVVLGHQLWQRRFGSNASIVGQQITLDGKPYEVIGVMPDGFQNPLRSEMWVPLRFTARELETQRGAHYVDVIGRVKPQVSLNQARENIRSIAS